MDETHEDALCEITQLDLFIESNKSQLTPPVCNKMIHNDGFLKVMIVGGPNTRQDYHMNLGEEIFYQIKGDMCLKIMEGGSPRDIVIKEGEMFVLPGRIPHSPQRFADTVGLVIERERLAGELDGLRYYVNEQNEDVLWQRFFPVKDLGKQLKPLIEEYFQSDAHSTKVPTTDSVPDAPWQSDEQTMVSDPFPLSTRLSEVLEPGRPPVTLFNKEFVVVACGKGTQIPPLPIETECWVWNLPWSSEDVIVNEQVVPPFGTLLASDLQSVVVGDKSMVLIVYNIA